MEVACPSSSPPDDEESFSELKPPDRTVAPPDEWPTSPASSAGPASPSSSRVSPAPCCIHPRDQTGTELLDDKRLALAKVQLGQAQLQAVQHGCLRLYGHLGPAPALHFEPALYATVTKVRKQHASKVKGKRQE